MSSGSRDRSNAGAELLGAGDAIDQGILIAHMLCELEQGPLSALEARGRTMNGDYIPCPLC